MYALKGGKALASTLADLSGFIPVPLLGEFMKVAIAVIDACEEATAVEVKVKDLQDRVYNLTLIIIDKVPVGASADEDLQGNIKTLQSILNSIIKELNQIKQQRKWLLIFFRDMNKERVDRCLTHVNEAMEQFMMSHQLHVEELLDKIKSKYSDVSAQLSDARVQLSNIDNKVDRIERAVKSTSQPHNAPQTLPRQDMPPAHRIFYGRESVVDDIISHLTREHTSRVCVTGVGGMGKTSVALATVHSPAVKDLFPNYRFWVPCVEATTADLLRRILYTQLRITAESYNTLDPLIEELNSSKERRLILLDNFETPWLSGESQDKISDILVRLSELPHIALIVTMASQFPPAEDSVEWQHRPLLPLDAVAARNTFERFYPGAANAPKLDELLTAVGHIPLAITLMAADGKHSRATPKDLLEEWRKAGTEMNSAMDHRISLSVKRVESNPEAFKLLAILSMLPAGTTGENLRWWAPTLSSHSAAVAALRTAALVEQEDGTDLGSSRIFLRPTIQAYMAQQNRIPAEVRQQVQDACYKFVLEHKSIPDDATFKQDLQELADEETNIQGLLMQIKPDDIRANALDALIAFGLYQSGTKPSTAVVLHALEVASIIQDDRCVAEAHKCLGEILTRLSRYEEACQHFEDARRYFKKSSSGADLVRAGKCAMQLSKAWEFMGKPPHDVGLLVEEAHTYLTSDGTDRYEVACGLLDVSSFLWWSHCLDEALEMLPVVKAIFEELECPASTAECLVLLAKICAAKGDYTTAIATAREALAMAEPVGCVAITGGILDIMPCYLMELAIYDDETLGMVERSLLLAQEMGDPLQIAHQLESLGHICAARMDLRAARFAYEAARAQYATIRSTFMGEDGEAACTTNLTMLQDLTEMDQLSLSRLMIRHFKKLKAPLQTGQGVQRWGIGPINP
ncbi:hypothetical protein B0H11DRAFT_493112 [Mycena galericulata]|nr:hypothetical protein B0H11DRAFT_493112 [Mycena galericulata]